MVIYLAMENENAGNNKPKVLALLLSYRCT